MSQFAQNIQYDDVDEMLAEAGIEQDASEVHGLLTGCLCAGMDIKRDSWGATLLGLPIEGSTEDLLTVEQHALLAALFNQTLSSLNNSSFDFSLLIPDDEEALDLRLQCVAAWCQGFVFGLNMLGKDLSSYLSDESREALQDVNDMMYLDKQVSDPTNEDEADYTQIVEYLRMVVILLFCELANNATSKAPHTVNKNIH